MLDGLGNHDTHKLPDTTTSFDRLGELESHEDWPNKGWRIYDGLANVSEVDSERDKHGLSDRCNKKETNNHYRHFNVDGADYCYQEEAYYYTVELGNPDYPSETPVAYLVQLHNEMGSPTAVAYLKEVRDNPDRAADTPIILVGHKLDDKSHSFAEVVAELPVAAIIHGHYHCDQTNDNDHCDNEDNKSSLLIDRFGYSVTNSWKAPVPRVNVSSAFHNIFWGVSLDTVAGQLSLKRFYRNSPISEDVSSGQFFDIVAEIELDNFPASEDFYTCSYKDRFGRGTCRLKRPKP